MALFVLEFKMAVAARDKFDFQRERAGIEAAAAAADRQREALADGQTGERNDRGGIVDGDGGVGNLMRDQRTQQAGAIARRATADVVRRLDEHGQAGRQRLQLTHDLFERRIGDVAQILQCQRVFRELAEFRARWLRPRWSR